MKPSLEYLIGRAAEDVYENEDDDIEWSIRLWGNALIHSTDGRKKTLPTVTGMNLLAVEHGEDDVTLKFGTIDAATSTANFQQDVILSNNLYAIADPSIPTTELYFPGKEEGRDDAVETRPEDPSGERIKDEPTMETVAVEHADGWDAGAPKEPEIAD